MALSSLSPSPIEKHNGKVVEQVHVSGNVWKLLQRSCCKSLEALVVVIGRKKKSAKLRSTQGRRVDHRPVGRKLVLCVREHDEHCGVVSLFRRRRHGHLP
jgi:hypothetical protein